MTVSKDTNSAPDSTRVRFAPSPTGYLHVGSARTAIFNWLFARKHKGKFLLRIEDTDRARSGAEMVEAIFSGLRWLSLKWDEEPLFQSQRFEIYKERTEKLVKEAKAYRCFCPPEKIRAAREQAVKEKRTFKYDRSCLALSEQEVQSRIDSGAPFAIRLRVDPGRTVFQDQVFGEIRVKHEQLDDFIVLRSDGVPTYHLAVVVDDHEMQITHVIRGDDHLSNTPKHILLYQAFGWQPPQFAHLPLILGRDHQRLSKRHGATALSEYAETGYLPEAMLNFLALLGWSSGDDRELFSRQELIEEFDLSGVMKKSAVFDERKLQWMNNQYIMMMENGEFSKLVRTKLIESGVISREDADQNSDLLREIAGLLKTRVKTLAEIPSMSAYFFADPVRYDDQAVQKHWKASDTVAKFRLLLESLESLKTFDVENIEMTIRGLAEKLDVSAAKLIHPTRVALTGVAVSPGLFEIMELLGQETVLRRLQKALDYLSERPDIVVQTSEEAVN